MAACPRCGEANPGHARFCLACGFPLEEPAAPREMRKTVTVVFSDVIDSTPLGERLDPETYRRVISRYFVEVSRVLERHGGTVEKFIGDAVMSVFGIPVLHEDDALRAVRAATELREALGELNEELQADYGVELAVRTGINTGEVVAGDPSEGQAFATGDAVAVAQRLEASASPGEILIGDPTLRLVREAVLVEPLEPLGLKGKSEPVKAWRLLGVLTGAPAFARRLETPMVGREPELTQLRDAFEHAVRERSCRLMTVLGTAGIGKSRLANELIAEVRGEATVLIGHCLPYGEGITYWPLRDIVRDVTGELTQAKLAEVLAGNPDADRIAERVAGAIGIAESLGAPEETMWAVRRLLEHLASERPLIVGFDDLQWAETTFLDLIEYVVGWSRDAPILIVCLARPDLLDRHPTWVAAEPKADSITLEPLSPSQAEELLHVLRGTVSVSEELQSRITGAAEGNPLFVEQMLAMLTEDGASDTELAIPPTIHALLAARLDRLSTEERTVLERASVVGKEFWRGAVTELTPEGERESLGAALMALVRREFIRPHTSIFPSEDGFRFRHILIRDAAYLGLPKEARAELHERYADWLGRTAGERVRELAEILGYHLEQAHRYRAELAPAVKHTRALASRAAELLGSAGRRAAARGDMPSAAGLLTRATLLLADDEQARAELAPDLGLALIELGELAQADGVLERAIAIAVDLGDSRVEFRARLERAALRVRIDPQAGPHELQETAEQAARCFEELGDEVGLARAWLRLSDVHWLASHWAARADALEEALVHARRAGHRRYERWILGALPTSLLFGPTPMTEAIARCGELLDQVEDDPVLEARVRNVVAVAKAAIGDFEEGREDYRLSRAILEELGHKLLPALGTLSGGFIELYAGDLEAAEAELRWGCERLEEIGEKASLSTVAAFLGRVLYARGRYDEAEHFIDLSDAAAQREDSFSQAVIRGTRAKLIAHNGTSQEAESLARATVSLAKETDALELQGDALMDLAEVLRIARRSEEALAAATQAVALYSEKGHVVSRARAEAWLADA